MRDRLILLARLLPLLPKLNAHKPGSRTSVGDRFEERARSEPDRSCVLFEDRRLDYGELNAAANRVAHWARAQGLARGDVVGLLMENRPEYLATWLGLAKLGVITALINTNLSGRALRHSLATAGATHLVLGRECAEAFSTTARDLESPLEVWCCADASGSGSPGGETELPGARDLDADLAARNAMNPDPALRAGLRAGDPLFYIYTSGTTGLPKAARFSHLRFLSSGDANAWALGLLPRDVYYCALPLYHTAGGVLVVSAVISAGATLALRRRFSAGAFWEDVRKFDATCFQYIGEFCRYLLNQPPQPNDRDHRIRAISGNGLRPEIWREFQERFGIERILEFYGATEGNVAFVNFENKVGSVGRVPFKFLTNARLVRFDVETGSHVRDAEGRCIECEPEEAGELIAKIATRDGAPGRFEGYTDPDATEKKILRDVFEPGDAWFRSGDLLRQDRDGFFYFVDRIGDTFRWKGENVSTQEVATALSGWPDFEMVNVYGVQVPGSDGRAGMAAVLLRAGTDLEAGAFYRYVDERLPRYAAPLFLRVLPEVEVTGTFKLRKVSLQEEAFDPARTSDPILWRDDEAGRYAPLTPEILEEIRSGERKL